MHPSDHEEDIRLNISATLLRDVLRRGREQRSRINSRLKQLSIRRQIPELSPGDHHTCRFAYYRPQTYQRPGF